MSKLSMTSWSLLGVVVACLAGCGQPKPREVSELRLDDKPLELKAAPMRELQGQFNQLCELAEFLSTQVRVNPKTGSAAGETRVTAGVVSPAPGAKEGRPSSSSRKSTQQNGGLTKISTQSKIELNASMPEQLKLFGEMTRKPVDPQTLSQVLAFLDTQRSGWRMASFYYSDTAALKDIKNYEEYYHTTVTLTPTELVCETEMSAGDKPRK